MELERLPLTLLDGLLVLEQQAAHLTALAAVADACAHVAREKADAAQRALSEVKIRLSLLPDDTRLELRTPKSGSEDAAARLGVRLRNQIGNRSGIPTMSFPPR